MLWIIGGNICFFHITQCPAELPFDREKFGSRSAGRPELTEDHLHLMEVYCDRFWYSLYDWPGPTVMHVHHRFTRVVYEYLLNDDRLPFPSILSPHQAYSHPEAGVCVYLRSTSESNGESYGYFDVQISDITYVLEYAGGMCPQDSMIQLHSLMHLIN